MRSAFVVLAGLTFTCAAVACGSGGSEFPEPGSSGTSGASNGGISSGGINPGGSSGAQEPFDPSKCASDTLGGKLLPVELTLVFDNSSSMCYVEAIGQFACGDARSKWPATTAALGAFLRAPESANLTVAVHTYGPVDSHSPSSVANNRCNSAAYEQPTIARQELPSEALANQVTSIAVDVSHPDATQTQTGPAITGSAVYSRNREAELAGTKRVAILLITDGNPAGCGDPAKPTEQTYADELLAVDAARSAYEQGTEVYVLNIGGSASVLDNIAAAGGTTAAINIADPTDTNQIKGALDQIRGKALSCDIQVPVPERGKADPEKLNITWTPNLGDEPKLIGQSPDCSDPRGWRYDNPENPTSIRLCAEICEEVLATETGKIDVVLGCTTYTGPVN